MGGSGVGGERFVGFEGERERRIAKIDMELGTLVTEGMYCNWSR